MMTSEMPQKPWLHRKASFLSMVTLLALTLGAGSPTLASSYDLSFLVKPGDVVDGKTIERITSYSRNNKGDFAFGASFSGGEGIFKNNSLIIQTGDSIEGETLTSLRYPVSLNNHGQLAFGANDHTPVGLSYRRVFTPTQLIANSRFFGPGGRFYNTSDDSLVYTDRGKIIFKAPTGMFTKEGPIVKIGDTINGQLVETSFLSNRVAVNKRTGDIAFHTDIKQQVGSQGTILTLDRVVVKEGDTIGGKTIQFDDVDQFAPGLSLNDHGDIAFLAEFSGGQGVFTQEALHVQTGDMIDGRTIDRFLLGFQTPQINNDGIIAFVAQSNLLDGLYTQTDLIVEEGDTIDGETLTRIGGSRGIFDNGDIIFGATNDQFEFGVILAKKLPTNPVPEPGTILLLSSGLIGLAIWRKKTSR